MEAEAAKSILESAGIQAYVDGGHLGSIMPHTTQALGGVRLKVRGEDEARAKTYLEEFNESSSEPGEVDFGDDAEEEVSPASRKAANWVKRATYGAVIGTFLLPLVSNLFSIYLYTEAYKLDRKVFVKNKGRVMVGMTFNAVTLASALFFLREYLRHRPWVYKHQQDAPKTP